MNCFCIEFLPMHLVKVSVKCKVLYKKNSRQIAYSIYLQFYFFSFVFHFLFAPPSQISSFFCVWLENIFVICNGQFARSETTDWPKLFVWLFVCLFYWQLRIRCCNGKKSILFASLLGEYIRVFVQHTKPAVDSPI